MDRCLSFEEHVEYIHGKAVKKLYIIRKARDYLDKDTTVHLYKSLVLPQLDCCDLIYGCTGATNLQKLQRVQNGACRAILRVHGCARIQEMHPELKLLTLEKRRELHLATECYKHVKTSDSSWSHMFVPKVNRRTRTGDKYKVSELRTTTGRKAFSYRGPDFWNQVPEELKNSQNPNAFKTDYLNNILWDVNHPT